MYKLVKMKSLELIKNDLTNGNTQNALEALIELTSDDSLMNNQFRLLLSQYKKWKRDNDLGLNENDIDLRRIEKATFEIMTEMELKLPDKSLKGEVTNHNIHIHLLTRAFTVVLPIFIVATIILSYIQVISFGRPIISYFGYILSAILILIIVIYALRN